MVGLFLAGGICMGISALYVKEKKALISDHVIKGMLAANFELIEYAPRKSFLRGQLKDSQLRGWARTMGNDFLRARYKGISFAFSDVFLSGLSRRDPVRFKGQWLILDLHKEIPASLILSQMLTVSQIQNGIGSGAWVNIELPPFRGTFVALTKSPELLPRVLTPAFAGFLLALRQSFAFNNEKHLFFEGTQAHIGINTNHDSFELKAGDDMQDIPALRERIQGEIDFIKEIIDGFLLTEWLFEGEQSERR